MQSLNNNPRQLNVNILLGALYESKSDWKKAEDAYQNALALNSQNPEAANDLARVLIQAGGSLDSALTLAQTARRGMPNSPIAVDTMGWIYYKQGTYPLAISNLMQALQLQAKIGLPDDPDIHYHLGLAYEKTGQPALARQQFEQVLKIAPHYRDAADVQSALVRLKS
jgi:tetratricopeptide (TPR) repeat protein